MSFDIEKLLIVLFGTFFFGLIGLAIVRGWAQRLIMLGTLSGVFFYSGIGGADESVSWSYLVYYFGLLASIIIGLFLGSILFSSVEVHVGRKVANILGEMQSPAWTYIIFFYIFLCLFALTWPEFRLYRLISPPAPDLRAVFMQASLTPVSGLEKLIGYVQLLLTPFFYLALYQIRLSLKKIVSLFAFLLYVKYVDRAYIGRGDVMVHVAMVVLTVWYMRPQWRKYLVVLIVGTMPIVLYGLQIYARIRIGGSADDLGILEGMVMTFESEWRFPKFVGEPLIASGRNVDIGAFLTWILTLPIPKIIIGSIEGARLNNEISEIVLGQPVGSTGWYIVLPGLVAESVYIYGKFFFWIHGLIVGLTAAFFARIVSSAPQLIYLYAYIVLLFTYNLNRAGVSSVLPTLVNEFMLLYLFLFYIAFMRPTRKE